MREEHADRIQQIIAEVNKGATPPVMALARRVAHLEASEHGLLGRLETCSQDEDKLKARIEQLEAELQAQRESTDIFRKLASPKTKEPEVAFKHDIFGAKQKKCTTDGCTETTIDHIIMGGIGSDYCIDCADKIIAKYKGERS